MAALRRSRARAGGDGAAHILMERSELIERLVPLIPPPRAHQVRYHSILVPSASLRDRIVPQSMAHAPECEATENVASSLSSAKLGLQKNPVLQPPGDRTRPPNREERSDAAAPADQRRLEPDDDARDPGSRDHAGRIRWAALLQRVFEVDAFRCPRCGATMRLLAAIEEPDVARRILECLELPARAPPMGKADGPRDEPARMADDGFFDQSADDDEP